MDDLSSDSPSGILSGSLQEYFASLLREVAHSERVSPSPLAFDYVSDLLLRYMDAQNLFFQDGVRLPVLVDLLHQANEADVYRRISILRRLGDTSLMMSGYFPEALSRRSVDLRYYQEMGGEAYSRLNDLSNRESVYRELSDDFCLFVDMIQRVSVEIKTQYSKPEELLQMYASSRHPGILKKLQESGIYPLESKKVREDS